GGGGGGGGVPPKEGSLGGQALDASGHCAEATFSRSVFVYSGPPTTTSSAGPSPPVPKPEVNYNLVFVKTPERGPPRTPIVVPPPQVKTIVYVLTKIGQPGQHVIEVPAGPGQSPEVYYVNYSEGDNPDLGQGLSLQEILAQAELQRGAGGAFAGVDLPDLGPGLGGYPFTY
ncbi:UNVERIFIED_CONTAM: hypothetical protein GTU68_043521, partial [Idotea baltica]|nr:hypothetical protein [Idotea baltica]